MVPGAGNELRWWSRVIDPPRSPGPLLFPGGPGKTNSREDFASLMNDLESKIFGRFDDDTVVHPGHGDDTTLGSERPHLAEWWKRGW
jgi:glyoxylase-like metal-dependent hydrolase (beta-lactamase superfamily II)